MQLLKIDSTTHSYVGMAHIYSKKNSFFTRSESGFTICENNFMNFQ